MQPFQQEQGDQGCPNLDAESILTGADEGLHGQVLFERFEEQFDLPALAVDGGDGGRGKAAMVRNTTLRFCSWSQTSMRRRNRS